MARVRQLIHVYAFTIARGKTDEVAPPTHPPCTGRPGSVPRGTPRDAPLILSHIASKDQKQPILHRRLLHTRQDLLQMAQRHQWPFQRGLLGEDRRRPLLGTQCNPDQQKWRLPLYVQHRHTLAPDVEGSKSGRPLQELEAFPRPRLCDSKRVAAQRPECLIGHIALGEHFLRLNRLWPMHLYCNDQRQKERPHHPVARLHFRPHRSDPSLCRLQPFACVRRVPEVTPPRDAPDLIAIRQWPSGLDATVVRL